MASAGEEDWVSMLIESGPKDDLLSFDIGEDTFLDGPDYNQQPLDETLDEALKASYFPAPSLLEINSAGAVGSTPFSSQENLPVGDEYVEHPCAPAHDWNIAGKDELHGGAQDPGSESPGGVLVVEHNGWSNDVQARDNANPSSAGSACTSSDESENERAGSDGSSAVSRVNEEGSVSPAGNSTSGALIAFPGADAPQSAPLAFGHAAPIAASPPPYAGLLDTTGHAGFYGVAAPSLFAPRILDPRHSMPYIGSLPARRGRRGGQKKAQASSQMAAGTGGTAVAAVASPGDNSQTTTEQEQHVSARQEHSGEQAGTISTFVGYENSHVDVKQTVATSTALVTPPATGANSGGGDRAKEKGGSEMGGTAGEHKAGEAEEGEDDEKRQARLVRNRESAQLSRQRKKCYVEELECQLRTLSAAVAELNSAVAHLNAENVNLRRQLALYYPPAHTSAAATMAGSAAPPAMTGQAIAGAGAPPASGGGVQSTPAGSGMLLARGLPGLNRPLVPLLHLSAPHLAIAGLRGMMPAAPPVPIPKLRSKSTVKKAGGVRTKASKDAAAVRAPGAGASAGAMAGAGAVAGAGVVTGAGVVAGAGATAAVNADVTGTGSGVESMDCEEKKGVKRQRTGSTGDEEALAAAEQAPGHSPVVQSGSGTSAKAGKKGKGSGASVQMTAKTPLLALAMVSCLLVLCPLPGSPPTSLPGSRNGGGSGVAGLTGSGTALQHWGGQRGGAVEWGRQQQQAGMVTTSWGPQRHLLALEGGEEDDERVSYLSDCWQVGGCSRSSSSAVSRSIMWHRSVAGHLWLGLCSLSRNVLRLHWEGQGGGRAGHNSSSSGGSKSGSRRGVWRNGVSLWAAAVSVVTDGVSGSASAWGWGKGDGGQEGTRKVHNKSWEGDTIWRGYGEGGVKRQGGQGAHAAGKAGVMGEQGVQARKSESSHRVVKEVRRKVVNGGEETGALMNSSGRKAGRAVANWQEQQQRQKVGHVEERELQEIKAMYLVQVQNQPMMHANTTQPPASHAARHPRGLHGLNASRPNSSTTATEAIAHCNSSTAAASARGHIRRPPQARRPSRLRGGATAYPLVPRSSSPLSSQRQPLSAALLPVRPGSALEWTALAALTHAQRQQWLLRLTSASLMGLHTCVEIFTFDPPSSSTSTSMGGSAEADASSTVFPSRTTNCSSGSRRNGTHLACDAVAVAGVRANSSATVEEGVSRSQRVISSPRRLFQQQQAAAAAAVATETAAKAGAPGASVTNVLSGSRRPASHAVPLPPSEHERKNLSSSSSARNKTFSLGGNQSVAQGHEHEVEQGNGNPLVSLVSVLTVGMDEKAGEGKGQPHVIVVLLVNGVRYVTYACLMPGLQRAGGAAAAGGGTVAV